MRSIAPAADRMRRHLRISRRACRRRDLRDRQAALFLYRLGSERAVMPDARTRMIATAFSPRSSASEAKNTSIVLCSRPLPDVSTGEADRAAISALRPRTGHRPGLVRPPRRRSPRLIGRLVARAQDLRQRALHGPGRDASTTMNAMPESRGTGSKNALSASTPPADAPIPTTRNRSPATRCSRSYCSSASPAGCCSPGRNSIRTHCLSKITLPPALPIPPTRRRPVIHR